MCALYSIRSIQSRHNEIIHKKKSLTNVCIYFFAGYFLSAFPFFSRRKNGQKPFTIYEDVVLRLLKAAAALGKGHHVYTDNYYTCVPMVRIFHLQKYIHRLLMIISIHVIMTKVFQLKCIM